PRTNLPLVATALTLISAIRLSLIGFHSAIAFNGVVSLAINSLYASFPLGNSPFQCRRLTGDVKS
ncbi:hypothetical protein BU16DRAFT_453605, partial [Lophium mytilinum]